MSFDLFEQELAFPETAVHTFDEDDVKNNDNYSIMVTKLREFLEDDKRFGYRKTISEMLEAGKNRLCVHLNDLRNFDPALSQNVIHSPFEVIPPFEEALKKTALFLSDSVNASKVSIKASSTFKIAITGSFGANRVTPRELCSEFVSQMVCVEGIVTKCSLSRPKLVQSCHYCPKTKKFITRSHRDSTSLVLSTSGGGYPTKDEDGNVLETEYGLCQYKNHQKITIQEMPEGAPKGQLPCSIDIILDDDLSDICKPGDRLQVIGIYRALAPSVANASSGLFRTLILANNVLQLGKTLRSSNEFSSIGESGITRSDLEEIRKISMRTDHFELLANSLAPSIYGHDMIKKALVLQLFGGVEQNLATGTHIRGDINVLMVGDPSTAKSQLLRSVLNVAPLALNTTGRGSSGVGLTAAVVQDRESGERRLEAGAMVLADRGIVCIDEFDKMSDADRVAIHEVMEQQTVTIAKAGIHTSLNARCSVVAAANPVYGLYDDTKSPQRNIGLPDSLLSRFDLLFIVLDHTDPVKDSLIADHVIRLHQYQDSDTNLDAFDDFDQKDQGSNNRNSCVFEKYNKLLHGAQPLELLSHDFFRKYVQFVRQRKVLPRLTAESVKILAEEYTQLRVSEISKTLPITARLLETMIRLATAHAKSRLSSEVEEKDCEVAIGILKFALFHDTKCNSKDRASGENIVYDLIDEGVNENGLKSGTVEKKVKNDSDEGKGSSNQSLAFSTERFDEVRKELLNFRNFLDMDFFSIESFLTRLNDVTHVNAYTYEELSSILEEFERAGIVMVSDGDISIVV